MGEIPVARRILTICIKGMIDGARSQKVGISDHVKKQSAHFWTPLLCQRPEQMREESMNMDRMSAKVDFFF